MADNWGSTTGVHNSFKTNLMKGSHLMNGASTIKVMLFVENHTPVFTTLVGYGGTGYTTTNELGGTGGYTQGGKVIANTVVSQESTHGKFTGDNVAWSAATFTCRGCIIYQDQAAVEGAAVDPLIADISFTSNQTVASGTFTIQWHADGIIKIT